MHPTYRERERGREREREREKKREREREGERERERERECKQDKHFVWLPRTGRLPQLQTRTVRFQLSLVPLPCCMGGSVRVCPLRTVCKFVKCFCAHDGRFFCRACGVPAYAGHFSVPNSNRFTQHTHFLPILNKYTHSFFLYFCIFSSFFHNKQIHTHTHTHTDSWTIFYFVFIMCILVSFVIQVYTCKHHIMNEKQMLVAAHKFAFMLSNFIRFQGQVRHYNTQSCSVRVSPLMGIVHSSTRHRHFIMLPWLPDRSSRTVKNKNQIFDSKFYFYFLKKKISPGSSSSGTWPASALRLTCINQSEVKMLIWIHKHVCCVCVYENSKGFLSLTHSFFSLFFFSFFFSKPGIFLWAVLYCKNTCTFHERWTAIQYHHAALHFLPSLAVDQQHCSVVDHLL